MFLNRYLTSILGLLGCVSAAVIPNNDGFPKPNAQQQIAIAKAAGGLLPNVKLPTKLGINMHVDKITKILTTVRAQEEQHVLAADAALKAAGEFSPQACQYQFPTTDLAGAISLAETFTAIVLGALQGANIAFAKENLTVPIQLISSVIGQEGEQNGFYRHLIKQVPSESPFLTPVPAPFAFSALQLFVVPGSCPFPLANIDLPILPALAVNGGPVAVIEPRDQRLFFSADLTDAENNKTNVGSDGSELWLTYTTGQQKPISVPITNVKWNGNEVTFDADFPFEENVMMGFTHAALTTAKDFDTVDDIVSAAIAAPAIIQVEHRSDCKKLADDI
ncbi:hypothetical protein MY11210_007150 [Beauveria gryllotalpidicola]